MRYGAILPALLLAAPLAAQNSGLPNPVETVVVMELIVERGLECGLLRPWQGAGLRIQIRQDRERLDEAEHAQVAREVEARRPDMGCDDGLLTTWIGAAGPNMEREFLPELLTAYRALALLADVPAPFIEASGRDDFEEAIARVDDKLAELEASGVRPPGGMTWEELEVRQAGAVAEFATVMAGGGTEGSPSVAQAERLVRDVAVVVELWLADEGAPGRSPTPSFPPEHPEPVGPRRA
jgi:hypothetical protein